MDTIEKKARLKGNLINNALGFFILLFGLVVFFSMSLSESRIQMMTNIVAGGSLVLIGGGMMGYAQWTIKKYDLKGLKDDPQ